jgi:hypothetical protein
VADLIEIGKLVVQGGFQGASGLALKGIEKGIDGMENMLGMSKERKISPFIGPLGSVTYWDGIYKSVKDINQQFGIGGNLSKAIEDNVIEGLKNVTDIGVTVDDIMKSYESFADAYGKTLSLSSSNFSKLGEINKLYGESYSEIFEMQMQIGRGVDDSFDHISDIQKDSAKIGVISKKTMDNLKDNIGIFNRYTFSNGIRGMTKMAKIATQYRISMQSATNSVDIFRDLDTNFEAVAKLQMLGGKIGQQFGDVFQLGYEARNSPEKIQERIVEITRGMANLNKVTGELEINPYNLDILRTAGEALNVPLDEFTQSARILAKENFIEDLFSVNIKQKKDFSDINKMVANMAIYKNGKWGININDEFKTIQEVDFNDIGKIESINKTSGDITKDLIQSNRSLIEAIGDLAQVIIRDLSSDEMYKGADRQLKGIMQNSIGALQDNQGYSMMKNGLDALQKGAIENMLDVFVPLSEGNLQGSASGLMGNFNPANDIRAFNSNYEGPGINDILPQSNIQSLVTDGHEFFKHGSSFYSKADGFFDTWLGRQLSFSTHRAVDDNKNNDMMKRSWIGTEITDLMEFLGMTDIADKDRNAYDKYDIYKSMKDDLMKFSTDDVLTKRYDTNLDGKISVDEFRGVITIKTEDGKMIGNMDVAHLYDNMKDEIEAHLAKNVKFYSENERKQKTIKIGR